MLAPDLVPEVKTGEVSLADAYKTAQEPKKAREPKEKGWSNCVCSLLTSPTGGRHKLTLRYCTSRILLF